MRYTLAQIMLAVVLLWLPFAFVRGLRLGSLSRGVRSATIRLGFPLVVAFLVRVNWDRASPVTRSKITGALVLVVLAALTARGSGHGGMIGMHGRGLVDRVVGRGRGRGSSGPVVPRQGGGRVVGPRPFNAGGVTYVPVAVDRGWRAARGVAGRVGRGSRRLEVVGGRAVRNVAEGRVPWRSRAAWTYLRAGAGLERLVARRLAREPWRRNQRVVEEVYRDLDDAPVGTDPIFVPGWMRGREGWDDDLDRLRRDVDRRGKP